MSMTKTHFHEIFAKKVGERLNLKDLRKAANLTQPEVARALDINQSAVSHWERGDTGICRKYRKRLCVLYDCTEEELKAAIEESRRAKN